MITVICKKCKTENSLVKESGNLRRNCKGCGRKLLPNPAPVVDVKIF